MQSIKTIRAAIDQYRLVRVLGRGAAGIVCEAEDTSLRRRVAIKWIPFRVSPPQILREAQLARQVRHPHVVSLYDSGTYSGGVFLVMEMMVGRSVQSLLNDGPLPWQKATAIMLDACAGIHAVHSCGIIHCDVKPANLLCGADGRVKLTDFGLACWMKRPPISKQPAGTPHYMSPEQCRADECDERTDIYSLGATYYTLLTGCTPYAGANALRIMFEHCSAPAPIPHKGIPRACAEIVLRAMAKQRADRFGSAREMQTALRGVGRSKAWRI